MGFYYSLYEWFNPLWLSDKKRYVDEHMFPQFKDLVTKYKPSVIFSDGEWDLSDTAWKSPELLAWLFNESPVANEVVVDDRWGKIQEEKTMEPRMQLQNMEAEWMPVYYGRRTRA
jgi:alpha-L-fucosidase